MTPTAELTLQYIGWFLALFELIFAVYLIFINPRNLTNILAGAFIFLLAVITVGVGSLAGAAYRMSAETYTGLLAALIPALFPLELAALISIFRPAVFQSKRWRWLVWAVGVIALIPVVLTITDIRTAWSLWYSGIPADYSSGYLPLRAYTQGFLSPLVYFINFLLSGLGVLIFLIKAGFWEQHAPKAYKRAAWILLIANLAVGAAAAIQSSGMASVILAITATLVYLLGIGAAITGELISVNNPGRSLQVRLTGLTLIVAIPMIIGISMFLTEQARRSMISNANQNLGTANYSVYGSISQWLEYNSKALQNLVSSPDAITMNSLWQKPLLEEMAVNYPYMYLISTVDVNGVNKARSDSQPLETYKDRYWFQNAMRGAPVTYEALLGKTNGTPSLIVSMPIYREDKRVVGVGMFASELSDVSKVVQNIQLGVGGSAFVVDQRNVMVSHSDPKAALLANMGGNPAVKAIREGKQGAFAYSDTKGERIEAYIDLLPNGWGVVTQQTEAGMFMPIRQIQKLAYIVLVIGAALMSLLAWTTIRQALRPIEELTEIARSISQGNLSRRVAVTTDNLDDKDELGTLADSFNLMTDQLQELIGGLESRVDERTTELKRRMLQLQVASEVARETAAIKDHDRLYERVVHLISERLGYDHVGIFSIESHHFPGSRAADPTQGFAVLRSASSEGGERMLRKGHRLQIGREGIVGFVASTGRPRIVLDVGSDAVYFNNPELPLTRSEMALPLKIQNKVIGILDVQSNQPSAFTNEDLEILQILADQVALAIENARLLSESRETVLELETQYGMQISKGWAKHLGKKPIVYTYDRAGKIKINPPNDESGPQENGDNIHAEINAPIELRGQRIGAFKLRKEQTSKGWSEADQNLVRKTAAQLALSLENARLMEEIRSKANQEEMINSVVAKTQSSLNLESVMKKAVLEIGRSMHLSRVQIRLGTEPCESGGGSPENGNGKGAGKHQTQESEE